MSTLPHYRPTKQALVEHVYRLYSGFANPLNHVEVKYTVSYH